MLSHPGNAVYVTTSFIWQNFPRKAFQRSFPWFWFYTYSSALGHLLWCHLINKSSFFSLKDVNDQIHPSCRTRAKIDLTLWAVVSQQMLHNECGTDLKPCYWIWKSLLFGNQQTTIQKHFFLAYFLFTSGWPQSKPTNLSWHGMTEQFIIWIYPLKSPLSSAPQHYLHFMEPCAPTSREG